MEIDSITGLTQQQPEKLANSIAEQINRVVDALSHHKYHRWEFLLELLSIVKISTGDYGSRPLVCRLLISTPEGL
jgi:hypothetical protein